MVATLILGFFSVLFAFLVKYKNIKWGLKASFALIFLFLSLRYNFGNDYKGYLEAFNNFRYSQINFFDKTNQFEPGWMILNYLFQPFGFFAMTAVLAFFHSIVLYKIVNKFVPKKHQWFAVFIYVFNPYFMLVYSSAMRQSVAITLFLFSIFFLINRKAIYYFFCVSIAVLFHTSALVLIPVYLLTYTNWKIKIPESILIIVLFISLFVFSQSVSTNLNYIISVYFQKYEVYEGATELGTGLGMAYSIILLLLLLYFDRLQEKEQSIFFKLTIISFMFIPLGFIIQLIGRVGMFFEVAKTVAFPMVLISIKKAKFRYAFLFIFMFMTLYSFFLFFNSEVWKEAFGTYQTIFSAPNFF